MRGELTHVRVSCEGSSALSIRVTPCPSCNAPESAPWLPAGNFLLRGDLVQRSVPVPAEGPAVSCRMSTEGPAERVTEKSCAKSGDFGAFILPGAQQLCTSGEGDASIKEIIGGTKTSDTTQPATSQPWLFGRTPSYHTHPSTGDTDSISTVLPRGKFHLRGELTHCFVSYRVATEGTAGNGLSGKIAKRIGALSMDDNCKELQIPRHGWGIWPKSARQPVPFKPEEAKVCWPATHTLPPVYTLTRELFTVTYSLPHSEFLSPEILNPKSEALNPRPSTLNPEYRFG